MADHDQALELTARFALRHYHDVGTSEAERDAILDVAAKALPEVEAESASRALYHLREAAKYQLELDGFVKHPRA